MLEPETGDIHSPGVCRMAATSLCPSSLRSRALTY
jgi:hypothetical protein